MIVIKSVAAFVSESTEIRQRSILQKLLSIASWLHADLHLIIDARQERSVTKQLSELVSAADSGRKILIHPLKKLTANNLLNAVEGHGVDLLILEYLGRKLSIRSDVLDKIDIPVMMLPNSWSATQAIPESLLVPLSSEARRSEALEFALGMAAQSKTPLDLLHVTDLRVNKAKDELVLESIGDQFHHEYEQILDRTVATASPLSTVDEKRWIRGYYPCKGAIKDEILKIASERGASVIVLDWHGTLTAGRAEVIKCLLAEMAHLIILVKSKKKMQTRLKIGPDLKSA